MPVLAELERDGPVNNHGMNAGRQLLWFIVGRLVSNLLGVKENQVSKVPFPDLSPIDQTEGRCRQ